MAREIIEGGPGESGLSARTKINNMFEELYGRTNILISDVAGYVPEVTELNDGQVMINIPDMKKYTRLGDALTVEDVAIHPNFTITSYAPDIVDEQTTGNIITVNGTGFTNDMELVMVYEPTFTIENVALVFISETELQIEFDTPDDIYYQDSDSVTFALKKGIYQNNNDVIDVNVEAEDLRAEITGQNPDPVNNGAGVALTLKGTNFTDVTSVEKFYLGDTFVVNSLNIVSDTQIDLNADINPQTSGGIKTIRIVAINPEGTSSLYYLQVQT